MSREGDDEKGPSILDGIKVPGSLDDVSGIKPLNNRFCLRRFPQNQCSKKSPVRLKLNVGDSSWYKQVVVLHTTVR